MWSPFGRWAAGFTDVEWSRTPEAGQSIAGRLYYPAASSLRAAAAAAAAGRSSWPSLLLRPWQWRLPGVPWLWDAQYARGLCGFLFFRLRGHLFDALKQCLIAFAVVTGKTQRMDLHPGAPLAPDVPDQLPLVVFSHGLGGNRFFYSLLCSELASQGYLVLALEHLDGSASVAKLPGGAGWRWYGGLGDEAAQVAKTRVRVAEMKAAVQLMQALHRGDTVPGAALSFGLDAAAFLRGRIDLRCVAAAGHSYGGATTAALVSEDPSFRCGVCLDPWWHALYPESKALSGFEARTPLLIVGSHDWNAPNAWGQLSCGGEKQERILAAAAAAAADGADNGKRGGGGGGVMLLSIAGSSHNTFADALPLFGQKTGWLLERLGLTARLDPVLGIHLCVTAVLHFLSLHLPLSGAQRAGQTWEPAKGHSALDRIKERDAADAAGAAPQTPRGLLSWVFRGRGLLVGMSDFLIDRMLPRRDAFRQVAPGPWPPGSSTPGPANNAQQQEGQAGLAAAAAGAELDGGAESPGDEPDDVATGLEVAEVALPSADPASGPRPHAPSAATHAPPLTTGLAVLSQPELKVPLSAARRAALRAGVNKRYSSTVEAGEVQEMHALLGSEHIFKCLTV